MIIGVGIAAFVPGGQTIGAALAGAGVSLYNYDKTKKFEFRAPVVEIGGGGKTETERVAELQEKSTEIERARAGTAPTSASAVTNDKYANGTATSSHGSMGGSGDLSYDYDNNKWNYTPSSQYTQDTRQRQLDSLVALSLNAEYLDGKTKSVIRDYRDNYYIAYHDNPYLNRNGTFRPKDPRDATYRGAMRGPQSSYGKGVMITSLTFETNVKGGGYLGYDNAEVFFHEIDHDRRLLGPRSGGRHESAYYDYVRVQTDNFFRSMHEDKNARGLF